MYILMSLHNSFNTDLSQLWFVTFVTESKFHFYTDTKDWDKERNLVDLTIKR